MMQLKSLYDIIFLVYVGDKMIRVSKVCGTCAGSKNAIDLALNLVKQGKSVCVYKEILHNKNVINLLEKQGVSCIDDLSLVNGRCVVIRAHGEKKETYDYLNSNNIEYYDATCKKVVKIHNQVYEKYKSGYSIIIIGKKNHPEVVGTNGWCYDSAYIVEDQDDIKALKIDNNNIFIICQTTFNGNKALGLYNDLRKRFSGKNIEFVNSICGASSSIQKASIDVAKESDLMIVIGGKNSSNTRELLNVCSFYCCSYLISSIEELFEFLSTHNIKNDTNIGITAGASTMKHELEEYKNVIEFYIDYNSVKTKCIENQKKYNLEMLENNSNDILDNAISELVRMNSDGKYIRAYLISLAYRIYGGNGDDYLALASAYELFQTSILIHDDIIDDSNKRRGKDTITVKYSERYNFLNKNEKKDFSNSMGICIGDLGFYLVNKIILDNYKSNKNLLSVVNEYNNIVIYTIKGEILDVELPFRVKYFDKFSDLEKNIFEIYKLKTAYYSVIGPFHLGMCLAGKCDDSFDELLSNLGIAFQIKDDILGIYGNSSDKSVSTDVSEFKQTILFSYIYDSAREYLPELLKYYGKSNLTVDDLTNVKNIFIESGAYEYANGIQEKLFDLSIESLDKLELDSNFKSILNGFAIYLKYRNK